MVANSTIGQSGHAPDATVLERLRDGGAAAPATRCWATDVAGRARYDSRACRLAAPAARSASGAVDLFAPVKTR